MKQALKVQLQGNVAIQELGMHRLQIFLGQSVTQSLLFCPAPKCGQCAVLFQPALVKWPSGRRTLVQLLLVQAIYPGIEGCLSHIEHILPIRLRSSWGETRHELLVAKAILIPPNPLGSHFGQQIQHIGDAGLARGLEQVQGRHALVASHRSFPSSLGVETLQHFWRLVAATGLQFLELAHPSHDVMGGPDSSSIRSMCVGNRHWGQIGMRFKKHMNHLDRVEQIREHFRQIHILLHDDRQKQQQSGTSCHALHIADLEALLACFAICGRGPQQQWLRFGQESMDQKLFCQLATHRSKRISLSACSNLMRQHGNVDQGFLALAKQGRLHVVDGIHPGTHLEKHLI